MATKAKCGKKVSKAKPKKALLGGLLGGSLGGGKSKNGSTVKKQCSGGRTKKKR